MPLMGEFRVLGRRRGQRADGRRVLRPDRHRGGAARPAGRSSTTSRPDVIVRESWEFASTLVAEPRGIPVVRVGARPRRRRGARRSRLVAPVLDALRARLGLPADPEPAAARHGVLHDDARRARGPRRAAGRRRAALRGGRCGGDVAPLPDWWPGNDDPLVYVTLGTVAGGEHLPYFPALYRAVDRRAGAAAGPAARHDRRRSGPGRARPAAGQRARRAVGGRRTRSRRTPRAIVCHGGYGSTLGALAHGVPLVVLPLFSIDQWANAARRASAAARASR